MKLLDRLERKYSKYAIHNLMLYIVFANAVVFILDLAGQGRLVYQLVLIPQYVFQGQIWRIFTFVMIPPTTSLIFIIFVLMFYMFIGRTLEQEWGSFKFNVYYFLGMTFIVISSLAYSLVTGNVLMADASYLNLTLFFAFATLYPNYEIRIYFILPVKVKYLAYISAVFTLFMFVSGPIGSKLSIIAGVGNYLLFFGKELIKRPANRTKNASRKKQYDNSMKTGSEHKHKCHVCGKTEHDDPSLEFRYCSKCDGYYEYCLEHLKDHEHMTSSNE